MKGTKDTINPAEMYLKSAIPGYSIAQYKLNKSLLSGHGSLRDKEKGLSWVTRAAANGQLDAQELLAGLALQTPSIESQKLDLSYPNNLAEKDKIGRIVHSSICMVNGNLFL